MNPVPTSKLQHVFKHGVVFGITGNWNPAKGVLLESAIRAHLSDPSIVRIVGTFRGTSVTHHYNPVNFVDVMIDMADNLVTFFKLQPGQLSHLVNSGDLGGSGGP